MSTSAPATSGASPPDWDTPPGGVADRTGGSGRGGAGGDVPGADERDDAVVQAGVDTAAPRGPVPGERPASWRRSWWAAQVRLPRPPLAVLVAIVAGAVVIGAPAGPLLLGVAVLVVVDALLVGAPWTLPVARHLPDVLTLGESATAAWTVRGVRPWPQRVALSDDLPPSLGTPRRVDVTVRRGRTTTAEVAMRPTRRGRHRPDELVVRLAGPLRLVARQHARSLPGRIDVHPAFPSRREAELRITDRRVLEVGMRAARLIGTGTEFEALRDYTRDDQVRRVDWSATARAGKPIVRTYRAERNQAVQVVLDTGRLSAGLVAGVTRLDHLMDAALAVATVAIGVGDRVGFTSFASGPGVEVAPAGHQQQRTRIASAMAGLEPSLVESDHRRAFTSIVARQRRRALLVLLTDLSSESLVDTLVPALPVLLSRHLVVVGAVSDPQVETWVRRGADATPAGIPADGPTVDGAYLAAGAATLQRTRRRTARMLVERGAQVVDAPPGVLAGRLMDAYLDVKAAGRL
ncbi:DUF58 domain-containing protein [Salsipaludibacter albus]|uniref:DUF58 domain-containing protein n=1 Tax=Salsipaludibacter albus TaxID=2849650 RepID=UPI001EE4A154|nr:DUF58 domain-containing protein [Salsipaludibacter albus]MBY5164196.1 DUF58 domain-containing protein [Salsipaludibacter albus]